MEKSSTTHSSPIFILKPSVTVEHFGPSSLAFDCDDLRLMELNTTARDFLGLLDGRLDLHQAAAALADDYGQSHELVLADIESLIAQLSELGLVRQLGRPSQARELDRELGDGGHQ